MRISLDEAASLLRQGQVVAIPTETVYGLAADASNDAALQQIFAIKQRPADHPLIVHIADIDQVQHWVTAFPLLARKLAEAFWPGALTLVLPAQAHVSRVVRGGESTVALRVPSHPVALQLLKTSGLSVAAPSANLFTQLSPTTAAHVESGLGQAMPVLDGGPCTVGIESTIVAVLENAAHELEWRLLRPGMISEAEIARVAGIPQADVAHAQPAVPTPKVPGQHALHYSPRTPLQLFADSDALVAACAALTRQQVKLACLLIGDEALPRLPSLHIVRLPAAPTQVAEQLYGALHHLDSLQVERLLVQMPPDKPDWLAVRDRLSRAGHQ